MRPLTCPYDATHKVNAADMKDHIHIGCETRRQQLGISQQPRGLPADIIAQYKSSPVVERPPQGAVGGAVRGRGPENLNEEEEWECNNATYDPKEATKDRPIFRKTIAKTHGKAERKATSKENAAMRERALDKQKEQDAVYDGDDYTNHQVRQVRMPTQATLDQWSKPRPGAVTPPPVEEAVVEPDEEERELLEQSQMMGRGRGRGWGRGTNYNSAPGFE